MYLVNVRSSTDQKNIQNPKKVRVILKYENLELWNGLFEFHRRLYKNKKKTTITVKIIGSYVVSTR